MEIRAQTFREVGQPRLLARIASVGGSCGSRLAQVPQRRGGGGSLHGSVACERIRLDRSRRTRPGRGSRGNIIRRLRQGLAPASQLRRLPTPRRPLFAGAAADSVVQNQQRATSAVGGGALARCRADRSPPRPFATWSGSLACSTGRGTRPARFHAARCPRLSGGDFESLSDTFSESPTALISSLGKWRRGIGASRPEQPRDCQEVPDEGDRHGGGAGQHSGNASPPGFGVNAQRTLLVTAQKRHR
jgi:hypothetical protein